MLTMLVTTFVLALLYGMAWHNQPARQPPLVPPAKAEKGGQNQP